MKLRFSVFLFRTIIAVVVLGQFCFASRAWAQSQHTQTPLQCGPLDFFAEITEHEGEHPDRKPSVDKALIYFFGLESRGPRFGIKDYSALAINGEWVSAARLNTYAVIEVAPGPLKLCTAQVTPPPFGKSNKHRMGKPAFGYLSIEAGKTYVIQPSPQSKHGVMGVDAKDHREDFLHDYVRKKKIKYVTWRRINVAEKP